MSNLNQFRDFCEEFKPKMLFLSETRTIEAMSDKELEIHNYSLMRCDAANRHTGGVAIYVHNSISAYISDKFDEKFIWALCIKVKNGYQRDNFCVRHFLCSV
jgi:exonuclease III